MSGMSGMRGERVRGERAEGRESALNIDLLLISTSYLYHITQIYLSIICQLSVSTLPDG